jgi:hypothetical protein
MKSRVGFTLLKVLFGSIAVKSFFHIGYISTLWFFLGDMYESGKSGCRLARQKNPPSCASCAEAGRVDCQL